MNTTARLVLEASTGVLGPDAQILAEGWAKMAAQNEKLKAALQEIDNWLVCAPIATAEDMAQSFEHMQKVASVALGHDE